MKEQENFDDLIRQKFAEKEFVFNEENWEKAEKKIGSARRFSKISLWTSIFIIGLFVGAGVTLLFIGKEENENTKNISEINIREANKTESIRKENTVIENPNSSASHSQVNENSSASQKINEKEIASEAESTSIINADQKPEKGSTTPINKNVATEKLINKNAKNLSPAALNDSKNEIIKTKKENKIADTEAKLIAHKTVDPDKQNHKNISKKSEVPVNEFSEKVEDNSIVTQKNSEKNKNIVSESTIPKTETINNEVQPIALITAQNKKVINGSETIPKDQSEKNSEKNNSDLTLDHTAQEKEAVNEPKSELASLTENTEKKINALADSSVTEIILPEKELTISKLDSSNVSSENKSIPPPPAPPGGLASATFFSVDAGTNFEFGWQYPDASEAAGFNPILGIGITHYINQKWSLQSGVEYGSIAYLNAQKVFTSTTYGFGSTSVDTVVHTKMLHYAVVPLLFEYHFNDKNAICFGGSISYLVNSKSKITINTTTIAPMVLDSSQTGPVENLTTSTNSMETGYYSNAFNKWDASLAIGYRRRISQKIGIAAIANIGLLDVKNNAFFSREQFERNVGLKIIISYDLFEF